MFLHGMKIQEFVPASGQKSNYKNWKEEFGKMVCHVRVGDVKKEDIALTLSGWVLIVKEGDEIVKTVRLPAGWEAPEKLPRN